MGLFIISLAFFSLGISTKCQTSEIFIQSKQNQEIIQAVKEAYNLEKQLYDHPDHYKNREQVYEHYRMGFCKNLAENLTNYSWSGSEILNHEKSIMPPDSVNIISIADSMAEVYYAIPSDLQTLWELKKYAIDTLKKENGHWKIYSSTNVNSIPDIQKNKN